MAKWCTHWSQQRIRGSPEQIGAVLQQLVLLANSSRISQLSGC